MKNINSTNRKKRRRNTRKIQRGGHFESLKFSKPLRVLIGNLKATGQLLNRSKTIEEPVVTWTQPDVNSYRTLICVDPNATAPSWLHWMVINSTGNSPESGTTVVPWSPPSPPPGSGTHTYYFCLFTHAYTIDVETPKQLGYFDLEKFATAHGLQPYSVATIKVASS